MAKGALVIVLAEDERHKNFVYRYLRRLDYSHHEIHVEELPAGRRCGEQWVRQKYAKNVAAYRSRGARAETALIVVIDADNGNVNRRVRQLQDALTQAGLPPVEPEEIVAHLIPRRSIETWILCLIGEPVDEIADYRNVPNMDEQIKPAALVLFAWSRNHAVLPDRCIPSLAAAIPEIKKLE